MKAFGLNDREMGLICGVFKRHAGVEMVKVFGSRAKGNYHLASDVDLAVWGEINPLKAEAIRAELDELPMPYKFEVIPFSSIKLQELKDHIERVGLELFYRDK